jgi:hypothetical protein
MECSLNAGMLGLEQMGYYSTTGQAGRR